MYECEACANGSAPSQSKTVCISCGALGVNATTLDCLCPANSKLVEVDPASNQVLTTKQCMQCPPNAFSSPGDYECTPCPHEHMVYDTSLHACTCDPASGFENAGLRTVGDVTCIETRKSSAIDIKFPSNGATKIVFSDFTDGTPALTVDSAVYKHYYMQVATHCYFYTIETDARSCQALANLCVLQHYHPDAAVCALFRDILQRGRTTQSHGVAGWGTSLPLLEYGDRSQAVLRKVDIGMKVSWIRVRDLNIHASQ